MDVDVYFVNRIKYLFEDIYYAKRWIYSLKNQVNNNNKDKNDLVKKHRELLLSENILKTISNCERWELLWLYKNNKGIE